MNPLISYQFCTCLTGHVKSCHPYVVRWYWTTALLYLRSFRCKKMSDPWTTLHYLPSIGLQWTIWLSIIPVEMFTKTLNQNIHHRSSKNCVVWLKCIRFIKYPLAQLKILLGLPFSDVKRTVKTFRVRPFYSCPYLIQKIGPL